MNRKIKRKFLIKYIHEKVCDCGIECRIDILNHIAGWKGQDILYFEGTGTRVLFDELDNKILEEIKKIIDDDLKHYKINFREIEKLDLC